ncbi:Uncharacterised protein [Vibrio cholerae]|nr:Uncharacterised protein [Vibrio cholerae]
MRGFHTAKYSIFVINSWSIICASIPIFCNLLPCATRPPVIDPCLPLQSAFH